MWIQDVFAEENLVLQPELIPDLKDGVRNLIPSYFTFTNECNLFLKNSNGQFDPNI